MDEGGEALPGGRVLAVPPKEAEIIVIWSPGQTEVRIFVESIRKMSEQKYQCGTFWKEKSAATNKIR